MPLIAERLVKYQYRRRLPHFQKSDTALFVTYCTNGPISLPAQARDIVFDHWLREGGVQQFAGEGARATRNTPRIQLHAVVVMPDHVHVLLTALADKDGWPFPLVDILQCSKSTTAHRINRVLSWEGPVWEEESFDHVLRSDENLKEKAEYIRQNPVEAGLVREARSIGGCGWRRDSDSDRVGLVERSRARAPALHISGKGKGRRDFSQRPLI